MPMPNQRAMLFGMVSQQMTLYGMIREILQKRVSLQPFSLYWQVTMSVFSLSNGCFWPLRAPACLGHFFSPTAAALGASGKEGQVSYHQDIRPIFRRAMAATNPPRLKGITSTRFEQLIAGGETGDQAIFGSRSELRGVDHTGRPAAEMPKKDDSPPRGRSASVDRSRSHRRYAVNAVEKIDAENLLSHPASSDYLTGLLGRWSVARFPDSTKSFCTAPTVPASNVD